MQNSRTNWLTSQVKGGRVLNIGFVGERGSGLKLHKSFQEKNPTSILVGIDINQDVTLSLNIENTLVADGFSLPFKSSCFDAVVLGEVIEHFFDATSLIAEISRVLNKGGKLYLTTPNPYAIFRWLRYWLFEKKREIFKNKNINMFLGNKNHKIFWEPISLINLLAINNLRTIKLTTKGLDFPYVPFLQTADLKIWPFNRLQANLCLVAQKNED